LHQNDVQFLEAKFRNPEFKCLPRTSALNRGTPHLCGLRDMLETAQNVSLYHSHIGSNIRAFDWYGKVTLNDFELCNGRYFALFHRSR